jgi:DNA invertase Pin-like site-specific DNA recombinase
LKVHQEAEPAVGLPASGTVTRSGDGRSHRSSGQPAFAEEAQRMRATAGRAERDIWQQESRKYGRERKNKLSQSQRTAILELHARGVKKREIARVLGISRLSVRKVLRSNSPQVPILQHVS